MKPPTPKEEIFVRKLIQGATQTDAAIAAGYKGRHVARTASRVLKRPRVQCRLTELLEEKYPDFETDLAETVRKGMRLAMLTDDLDALTRFLDKFARLAGYASPTKTLTAVAKLPRLPESEE